ncbi:pentapeptide repeat-containing protein [uncultured Aquimarina sp.]|uniref:pentapeptide repeat-containing protein n=1 Tax=uncultured Aquimarina sp. TaxID=575652 RepID=UPI00261DE7E9|nr:pentapeptide repeat-containing protein [uncultured Aquimarina sp.]
MSKQPINTDEEFETAFRHNELNDCDINVSVTLPYSTAALRNDHIYKKSVEIIDSNFNVELLLNTCGPMTNDDGKVLHNTVFEFIDCHFYGDIVAEESTLDCKVKFRNCHFHGDVNFRNTTFKDLADFWKCTFYKPTTFYKTDFLSTVVFSASTFKENALFTYTLIDKLMILRGTNPEKGFDLSLAIIAGQISVYDFKMDDYNSFGKIYKETNKAIEADKSLEYNDAYEKIYDAAVTTGHIIPIENKRETYRILKSQLESQKNFIDAVPYRVMENKTLLKESWKKLVNGHTFSRPISNIIVLSLNAISNWFGQSYILAFIFTASIGGLFFTWMLSYIGNFELTTDISKWQWQYFVQYLNPTHRFDFMKAVDESPSQGFYILDFVGRIFIGYGIYQIIQAFRKYK